MYEGVLFRMMFLSCIGFVCFYIYDKKGIRDRESGVEIRVRVI